MCWQCDNPHRTTDDYLDVLREIIDGHQWAVHYVEDEDRPFAYTVGLTDHFRNWPWDRGWGHGRRRQPVFGIRGPVPG
ncbi:MAG: hypothetical protein ACKVP6_14660 [Mycobacterium sp.]